jgi:drug/metabolite transporter (DMT)-like permease
MTRLIDYLYIFSTIIFTVYGQLILKWRISQLGALPTYPIQKLKFLLSLLFDPFIFSGFAAAFVASLAWMAAMTKFEISHAYPFMSLNFVLVLILSVGVLGETVSFFKVAGIALIVFGTVVAARG